MPLYWGRTYYVIGHLTQWEEWDTCPNSIQRISLAPRDEWGCCIISLPIEEDQEVSDWVECFFDREISTPPLHIDLVYPLGIETEDERTIQIDGGKQIIIVVDGEKTGQSISDTLRVKKPENQTPKLLELHEQLPAFVSLGYLPLGKTEISLTNTPSSKLVLFSQPKKQSLPVPGVDFAFTNPESKQIHSVPAFSNQITTFFEEIPKGTRDLKNITLPKGLSFYINDELVQSNYRKSDQEAPAEFNDFCEKCFEKITEILRADECNVDFDFGNYGTPSRRYDLEKAIPGIELSSSLRQRLQWIIGLTNSPLRNQMLPLSNVNYLIKNLIQITESISSKKDKDLFQRLLNLNVIPIAVEPHLRAFLQDILKASKKQKL